MNPIKKISFFGFILGAIVNIVGTNVWGMIAMIIIIASYQLTTLAPSEMTARVLQILQNDPIFFSANLIVGSLFSILGGYLAAWIAKHDEVLNGGLSSFLCVFSTIYAFFTISSMDTSTLVLGVLSLPANVLLSMLGGYFRLKQKAKVVKPIFSL